MSSSFLKFQVITLLSLSRAKAKTCDLECNGHGTCKFGDKLYETIGGQPAIDVLPWGRQNSIEGMYCKCDPGYTGVTCEIEHEICSYDSDNQCFNGGTCLRMYVTDSGKWENRCDCTTAIKGIKEKDLNQVKRYAGQFCQYEETSKCGPELFCTNGGKCVKKGTDDSPERVCECPEGFSGPRCEYMKDKWDDIPCDLGCQNGGQCAIGPKDFATQHLPAQGKHLLQGDWLPFMEVKEAGFMHCICPEGYTGLLCDIKYEQCTNNVCYFGSTCADDTYCDCTSAYTKDTSYAGLQCEYPSTTKCPTGDGQHPGDAFCTNGGICHDERGKRGCYCPKGFSGPRCEQKGDVPKPCDLECENGGKCLHGVKYHEFGEIMSLNEQQNKLTIDGMFCACPTDGGFAGVRCEIPVESCYIDEQKDDHVCLHGAKCRQHGTDKNNKPRFTCDCSTTTTVDEDGNRIQLAGKFCEYKPTDICVLKGQEDYGLTNHFCTNGGKCNEIINSSGRSHRGCDCPDGYEGSHCELAVVALDSTEPRSSSSNGGRKAVGIFLLVVLGASTAVVIGFSAKNKVMGDIDKDVQKDQFAKEEETKPPETEITEDGELDDVII